MTPLDEFDSMLEHHDWYYSFSDDGSVYARGHRAEATLRLISQQSPAHKRLYDGWCRHMFSGPAWGTEHAPRPAIVPDNWDSLERGVIQF